VALFCVLLGVCPQIAPRAWSQSGVSLVGSVQDITGGIIAGAPLILYSADTAHIVDIVISDQDGSFEFKDLLPGTYDLKVEEPGFKRQTIKNIKIADKPPQSNIDRFASGKS
jgi:hypothetical protein